MRTSKLCSGGKGISLRHGKQLLRCLPLVGMLFATSSVNAANSPGVTFNPGVRYSQWAINSRLYDFRGNKNAFGFAKWDASTGKVGDYPSWGGGDVRLDYVAGLVGKATIEASEYYDTDWSKPWFESAKDFAIKRNTYSAKTDVSKLTLDNMNAAKMFIPLTNGNSEWISSTEQSSAKNFISEVIKDLVKYNSKLFIGSAYKGSYTGIDAKTAKGLGMFGAWYHKPVYIDQTWCDGMYMGPALLAQIVKYNGKTNNLSTTESDWDILARQFTISWKQLYNESTGLLYHGFTANPGDNASKDWDGITAGGTTYHSASFWGRANAWYFLALVDVLEAMPTNNSNYDTLKGYLAKLAAGIKKYQDNESGCWYQVLDKTSASLKGNYLEASCSSIFTAAYLKAIRLGLLDKTTYEPVATKAYEGLVNQFMVYDNKDANTVQLVHSCTSAGLGNGRAGNDDYYINGSSDARYVTSADPECKIGSTNMYYTEGKVLGGFIMAATEYERAYQDQDNKKILFAKDLAPTYTINTSTDVIDATAYGTGAENAKYQWYKGDGTAVANATSATFSPKESGSYYCTATANGKTIKTSTTTVTAATEGGDNNSGETTTKFSAELKSDATLDLNAYTGQTLNPVYMTATGGDVYLYNGKKDKVTGIISVKGGISLTASNNIYLRLTLNKAIASGDIIEITSSQKSPSFYITTTDKKDSNIAFNNKKYEVKDGDKLIGQSILYFWNNNDGKLSSIKITSASGSETPTTKKYTVTATAGDGGKVAIKNALNEEVTSGTEVEEKTSLTFTATAKDGYEFVNWTDVSNGTEVNAKNPYTTTVSADINIKANFKKKEVTPSTSNESVTFAQYVLDKLDSDPGKSEVSTQNIGEITITALDIKGSTGRGIKMSRSEDSSFKITAADGAKIKKIIITQDRVDKTLNYAPAGTESQNKSVFTYDYSSSLPTEITVKASTEGNIYVSAITVEYESSTPSTSKTDLTAAYATESVAAIVGDEDINAPELTVTAGETALEEGTGYSVSYTSGDENVVKVQEDGTLDAVGKGTATITATITPADGTKYNNKPLTFTINVSARPLKAVFSTNAVSANDGDEPRALPTLTVTDVNLQQQVSDYTATYSSTNEGVATVVGDKLNFVGAGKTTIKVTVTPKDENTFAPCEASFDVSVADETTTDPTQKAVVYDFTTSVGNTESANANIKVNSDNIMFGTNFKANESKYLTITPNGDGGFKAGDVITLKGYCPKENSGILIYADPTDAEPQFQSPAFADTEVEYTFTVQKDSPVLYLGRFGGSSTYVTYLNVTRPATSGNKTRLTAAFERNSDVIINDTKNYTIDLPALTVKAGNEVFDKYSVVYSSNDKAVATVDGNSKKITIETPGTVTILATVKPIDANSYEGCTATYTITVKDPTPLVISTMDVMMNATDAKVKQPIIKVYGDDDKLLTLNTDYTLSFSVKSATEGETTANVSVLADGTFKVEGKEYNWKKGSSVITVTATPITEHIGDTYINGTLDFIYNVVKGKLTPAFMNNFASEVIKIKQYDKQTNNNSKKFRVPLIYNGEDVSEYFKYTYTVKKSDGTLVSSKTLNNGNEFTFKPTNKGDFTIYVSAEPKTGKTDQDDYTDVYNAPAPMQFNVSVDPNYIRPVITFNPESVQMYVGTTEGAPDVTVTDGTKEISNYNLKWVSFSPSYVKVDGNTGKLEAVSEGQGSVRITVTGDNLESMTAFLSVYVDDPAVYRTKSTEKYGNQRKMWNQDGTMSVTLGGWMFPNDVTKTKYSDEGLRREYCWADNATQPKWKMTGFDRFVSGEKSKNARQENGSNAMPNTTMVSTADFQSKGTVRDAMFNVPCSGSYLTFNPKTNGTVSVHIFQNGAFDSGVYRPQRRVFVMDEQGNFVQSTPEIENANGKPTGGLKAISNYKWDINPKGANTAPAIEDVRLHFKNIPTDFDMTTEKFQNNIYESNLGKDIVPNAAYNEKVPGSNGWCVLADSPVTYSFKVKAGKTYYLWNFGSKIGFYGYSFDEDETKPDEISYDENSTNDVKSTEEGHVAKVSIKRSFKAGVWSTCVLPFSLNMSQVDAIFGDTYRFGNENGTEILYFDRVDENGKVWFVRHAYNTIVANKPFLIKPTKDVNGINTTDCAEYPYVTIEAPKGGKLADWCSDGNYAWVSSYNNDMTLSKGDGYIGGTSGNFIQSNKDGVKVKGFRGFLKGLTPAAKTHVLSTMTASNTDVDGNTTFIDGLVVDGDGNFVPTATDGKVYSINGQLVGKDMKSLGSLPSGVYIINGKKYIK